MRGAWGDLDSSDLKVEFKTCPRQREEDIQESLAGEEKHCNSNCDDNIESRRMKVNARQYRLQ